MQDATTAAFATLVLLRRALLRAGRDLLLTGLHDRAAYLFGINRLGSVLPCTCRERPSATHSSSNKSSTAIRHPGTAGSASASPPRR